MNGCGDVFGVDMVGGQHWFACAFSGVGGAGLQAEGFFQVDDVGPCHSLLNHLTFGFSEGVTLG